MTNLELALSPQGRLLVQSTPEAPSASDSALRQAFATSSAHGLLALAAYGRDARTWPSTWSFWREFADSYLTALAHSAGSGADVTIDPVVAPPELCATFALRVPPMRGAEYASTELFATLWQALDQHARTEAARAGSFETWLHAIRPALHLLGKVTFHLAENKRSPDTPFAFMATYTHRLSAEDKPVHLPLARALEQYAGAKNRTALRALLEPVQRAAALSDWVREQLDTQMIFEPQAWTPPEAYAFLREVPVLEQSGIVTRIPNWWKNGRGARPQVSVRVGGAVQGQTLGLDTLLTFDVDATLAGDPLTDAEWRALLAADSGLALLRGQWVEVDRERLAGVLRHWREVQKHATGDGVSFLEGMRLLAGVRMADGGIGDDPEWSAVSADGWLRETLASLRSPEHLADLKGTRHLAATLRPYQETGVKWLWLLQSLGLGACLADDMGLGKTIQVIALLLQIKHGAPATARDTRPSLLIAPASLLANWQAELARFAPTLRVACAHPAANPDRTWRDAATADDFTAGKDVILTTYGQALRLPWLATREWRLLVLDEAQAIKNPNARQTRAVKRLRARARIALSGTPVENSLGDLWSLYDFLNPGLLGAAPEFTRYVKKLQASAPPDFAPLRRLVRPYLLRRLKTDRDVIRDLPDKTESTAWCGLSRRQAALYAQSVKDLATQLSTDRERFERGGVVLAFLTRFKQICNHPSQWLGDGDYRAKDSGKFQRLAELCEEIAARQEKLLVFTQYREMTAPLAAHLRELFARPGLVLHGGTPVKERRALVDAFQRDDGPPFFVLSLKAGGTGLNLTAASHVVHFDRWWNPAVENQATDRAFRIGQKQRVLVHKFVCRGTIEERIDAAIRDKQAVAEALLGATGGAEKLLTEMSNDELLRFVALDLAAASSE